MLVGWVFDNELVGNIGVHNDQELQAYGPQIKVKHIAQVVLHSDQVGVVQWGDLQRNLLQEAEEDGDVSP